MSLLPSGYAIRLLSAFCIAFIALTASASAQVKDHLNIPGPISFDGQSYELAWSSHPSTNYIKQEYLPKAQTVGRYSEMLLVEFLKGNLKVADAVGAQMQKLNARKGTDPIVKMAVVKNDATAKCCSTS
jgi:hypothetical protein